MITGWALCPQPPLLLREWNGRQDAVPELRAACAKAVDELVAGEPGEIVVVVPDGPYGWRVGERLLAGRWSGKLHWQVLPGDLSPARCVAAGEELASREGRTGVLVLADGSACRTEKAPGYLDTRAQEFDAQLTGAIGRGDWQALADLDTQLATELLVQGRAAFQVLGAALRPSGTGARLLYLDDPFGVMYLVATGPDR